MLKKIKTGFTLMEILSVIFIIGIISTVAIPAINKLTQQTRENLYQTQIRNIETGTKNWSSKNARFLPKKDGEIITITLSQLKTGGYVKENIKNPINKKLFPNDMEIMIMRVVNNYRYKVIEDSGGVNDTIDQNSPTIILNGTAHETVEIHSKYVDKGVIARNPNGNIISNVDVKISLNDTIVSKVDTSKLLQYKITYTIVYNEIKTSAIRTVTVRDTVPPVLTIPGNIEIYTEEMPDFDFMKGVEVSDNSLEKVNVTLRGNITTIPGQYLVTYIAEDSSGNKTEKNRYITIFGNKYPEIIINGDNPTSIYVEQVYKDAGATATDSTDGDITSKIITVGTVNPNVPGTYTIMYRVTNSRGNPMSVVRVVNVIDNVPPVITFSPNGNSTYAKSHTTKVTVTDKHSAVNASSLKYLWSTSTSTPSEGSFSTSFTNGGTISTPSGVTGNYYLWILAKDTVGNRTIQRSNVFRLDNIPPTCVSSGGNATWTNGNRTITGTCSDTGGSGCKSSTVTRTYSTNTNTTTASPGTVSDNAGNTVTCPSNQTVKIDKTPPTCASSGGSTTWTNGNRTITGTCSDTGGSGCKSATVTKTYSTNTNTTTASPGSVSDNAGNTTSCPANRTVRIDKTPPTCTSSGGSTTWTTSRTITGTCSDTGGSGCAGNVTKTYSTNTNITNAGPGTVSDKAGNTKACPANQTVKVDRTPPTCVSSGGSATWTNGNRTITGTCSDTGGSGCKSATVTKTYSTNTNTTTASPGSVSDNAGNTTSCPANRTVKIDKTAPTCTSSGGSSSWATSRTITGTCKDTGGSGCVGNVSKSYTTTTNTTASPGTVKDNAGNTKACPSQTVKVDKTAPITFTTSIGTRTTSSIVVSASGVRDDHVGLHSTAYSFSNNGGSSWTAWRSGASYTYTGLSSGTTYSMRVRVRDALGNIRTGGSVSAKTLATITKTYALSSSQTYRGSSGSKYNNYPAELIQGTYDGTLTSTRNTLMIFPHSTIRSDTAGATINSVRVRMKRLNTAHGNGGTATLYVRSHNYSSMPSTWYNSGVTQRATASIGRGQELWITLPIAVGNGFRDNTIKGLAVSTTSTSMNYYVRLEKARTLLEIKYTK